MKPGPKTNILFVCLGNICRSPSAEMVLRTLADQAGIPVEVDSAGTGNWHIGQPPDARAFAAAAKRGMDMSALRARQVTTADFTRFAHILAMDRQNLAALEALRPPGGTRPRLFMEYAANGGRADIPDPYYGGEAGFEQMFDMIEDAARGLLETLV